MSGLPSYPRMRFASFRTGHIAFRKSRRFAARFLLCGAVALRIRATAPLPRDSTLYPLKIRFMFGRRAPIPLPRYVTERRYSSATRHSPADILRPGNTCSRAFVRRRFGPRLYVTRIIDLLLGPVGGGKRNDNGQHTGDDRHDRHHCAFQHE